MKTTICISIDPKVIESVRVAYPLVKRSTAIQHLLENALAGDKR